MEFYDANIDNEPVVFIKLAAVFEVCRLKTSHVRLDLIRRGRFARVALDRTCHKPPYFYFRSEYDVIVATISYNKRERKSGDKLLNAPATVNAYGEEIPVR